MSERRIGSDLQESEKNRTCLPTLGGLYLAACYR